HHQPLPNPVWWTAYSGSAANPRPGRPSPCILSRRVDGRRLCLFHGWKVVATAFLVALYGWGFGFYGAGVYLATLAETRGWGTGTVGAAITGYYLLGAAALTVVPRLIE